MLFRFYYAFQICLGHYGGHMGGSVTVCGAIRVPTRPLKTSKPLNL